MIFFYVGWLINPLNSPTRGALSRVTKFLALHKVSWIVFTYF